MFSAVFNKASGFQPVGVVPMLGIPVYLACGIPLKDHGLAQGPVIAQPSEGIACYMLEEGHGVCRGGGGQAHHDQLAFPAAYVFLAAPGLGVVIAHIVLQVGRGSSVFFGCLYLV